MGPVVSALNPTVDGRNPAPPKVPKVPGITVI